MKYFKAWLVIVIGTAVSIFTASKVLLWTITIHYGLTVWMTFLVGALIPMAVGTYVLAFYLLTKTKKGGQ